MILDYDWLSLSTCYDQREKYGVTFVSFDAESERILISIPAQIEILKLSPLRVPHTTWNYDSMKKYMTFLSESIAYPRNRCYC